MKYKSFKAPECSQVKKQIIFSCIILLAHLFLSIAPITSVQHGISEEQKDDRYIPTTISVMEMAGGQIPI